MCGCEPPAVVCPSFCSILSVSSGPCDHIWTSLLAHPSVGHAPSRAQALGAFRHWGEEEKKKTPSGVLDEGASAEGRGITEWNFFITFSRGMKEREHPVFSPSDHSLACAFRTKTQIQDISSQILTSET